MLKVHKVLLVLRVLQVHRVLKDPRVLQVHRVLKALVDLRDL